MLPPPDDERPARPHGPVDLARRQLEAVDRWHRARRASEATSELLARTREARLDRDRVLAVTRTEHQAMIARTQQQLRDSATVLRTGVPRRAVLVHRSAWFVAAVCAVLEEHGVQIVAVLENGAEAVGLCVAEQPDVLLVEDSLPMLSGAQVLRKVASWSPHTLCGAHVGHDAAVADVLEAGACRAWTRRVAPGEVGLGLVELAGPDGPPR